MSLVFILFLFCFIDLFAQEEKLKNIFDPENKKYQNSLERYYLQHSIMRTISPQVLEDILDENSYLVGPGDGFQIYLWGEIENHFNVNVNPQGTLIVPSVGEIDVYNLTLAESKSIIKDYISKKYLSSEISINLVALKKFRVYVTGEIELPGTYFVQASDRVSDVVEIANGLTDWSDGTRIQIRHNNGQNKIIDLSEFYLNGRKEANPYLNSGDVIYIPAIDVDRGYVIVEGNAEIASSFKTGSGRNAASSLLGVYPLKDDEKLYDFLRRVGALSRKSDLENVLVIRKNQETHFDLLANEQEFLSFTLRHKDKIVITPSIDRVYVRGEVFRPGELTFKANFKAKDYVGRAGALESGSDQEDYVIIRHETGEILEGADVIIYKGDTISVPKNGTEELKDLIVIITPGISLLATVLILLQGVK